MKNSTGKIFFFVLFLLVADWAMAQDPEFTQFYANPVYTNPAMAGSSKGGRATLAYRLQWPGWDGNIVTTAVGYDQYFKSIRGGIGILATSDQAGNGILRTSTY